MSQEGLQTGSKKKCIIHALPEINPEVIERLILGAYHDASHANLHIYGPYVPRMMVGGKEVDGMLVATFAQEAGLDNPTLAELISAAEDYVRRFKRSKAA